LATTLRKYLLFFVVSAAIGLASSIFLQSLELVTELRTQHTALIFLLPLVGFIIAYVYHTYGAESRKGNHLLIEAYQNSKTEIPLGMAALIFSSTLLTHLVGGSAGREGTAVQMGGAIAYYFKRWIKETKLLKQELIVIGISAGFAGVFGTPLAAGIFALEVIWVGNHWKQMLLPAAIAAGVSHYACIGSGASHTSYVASIIPWFNPKTILCCLAAGLVFGMAARGFVYAMHWVQTKTNQWIHNPMLRPTIGGCILLIVYLIFDLTYYQGLGIEGILNSFDYRQGFEVSLIKILLTVFTLGVGFKGGEVTPLFFIGASLGSALTLFIPLPISTMAAIGFTAVFAAAANVPLACTMMAIELFGIEYGAIAFIANFSAYLVSDKIGIYTGQSLWLPKISLPLKHNK
jgi:H+/Cl- antiporter ClcA